MKKIITETDIQGLSKGQKFVVSSDMIITPLARERASREGIILEYERRAIPNSEDIPIEAKLNNDQDLEKMAETLAQEVLRGMKDTKRPEPDTNTTVPVEPALPSALELENVAVVLSTGVNHPGVVAGLSNAISSCGADLNDISQTLAGEFFSMIFVVDISGIQSKGLGFMDFKQRVEEAGKGVGAQCVVFNAQLLKAMHRV